MKSKLIIAALLLYILSCGVDRQTFRNDMGLQPAVTIEEGRSGLNRYDSGTEAQAYALAPKISVNVVMEPGYDGGFYTARISWSFGEPVPDFWRVAGEMQVYDPEGRIDWEEIEHDGFQTATEALFVSRPLQKGHLYSYDIMADVEKNGVKAMLYLKRVTIDLKDAK
ncbi:hypothetical protein K2X33_14835 [bacterium]|nr:hypothetical protein [bacterium]